mgnify:CR=1 FL=1
MIIDMERPSKSDTMATASPDTLRVLSRLLIVVENMPAVFPTKEDPTVRPLKIHVASDIHNLVVLPEGMKPGKAHAIVADVLRLYANSPEYLKAMASSGAFRFDLDGNPVEPVSQEHAELARRALAAPRSPIGPSREIIKMQIPAIKVTIPLSPEQLHPVAETTKTVELSLDLGDGRPLTAPFSGRTYRRALRQVDELRAGGAGIIVIVMQGRLVAGGRIEQAGLAVQIKTAKG